MKTNFSRRQLLRFLAAAGFGPAFARSRAQDPRVTAENPAGASVSRSAHARDKVLAYLKAQGRGSFLFGQIATWVHNENPDIDHPSNWIQKVRNHTGKLPRYGCITYDFDDNPFSDAAWNAGVKKLWDRGLIAGVYSFFANPAGGRWNDACEIERIYATGENPVKSNFHQQLDRMAANLQWLRDRGIPVVYTPFVESDDRNKWHAKQGHDAIIRLYRLVHDYFQNTKKLDNIIWAYHTTQNTGALERCYPGDAYVDVLGKSAYGTGLPFDEYDWAVTKKQDCGKIIWWAELGIRGKSDPPRDCFDVLKKLESRFSELAGFVFWSDEGFYNAVGNLNGREFMAHPKIVALNP
ncbi:MAG TPA: glycosyl hydrolase [Candidatus Paceibacterota bacterium]|nr:glycosyl hydrolase [Verrucomicrobiota bacterium]HRY46685.1 glycosyl hydrolase [Candidatus Paceibacterota bacterium]